MTFGKDLCYQTFKLLYFFLPQNHCLLWYKYCLWMKDPTPHPPNCEQTFGSRWKSDSVSMTICWLVIECSGEPKTKRKKKVLKVKQKRWHDLYNIAVRKHFFLFFFFLNNTLRRPFFRFHRRVQSPEMSATSRTGRVQNTRGTTGDSPDKAHECFQRSQENLYQHLRKKNWRKDNFWENCWSCGGWTQRRQSSCDRKWGVAFVLRTSKQLIRTFLCVISL